LVEAASQLRDAHRRRSASVMAGNTVLVADTLQQEATWVEVREMDLALKALEKRVLQKVEDQLAQCRLEARFVDSKVNEIVAPLLESVIAAKLDADQRSGTVSALVESMALAQLDMKAKLAEIEQAVAAVKPPAVTAVIPQLICISNQPVEAAAVKPTAATAAIPQLICVPNQPVEEMSKTNVQQLVAVSIAAAVQHMGERLLHLEGDIRGLHDKVDKAHAWAATPHPLGAKQWAASMKSRDAQDELGPNGANALTATRQIYLGRSLDKPTISRSMPQLPPVR